MEGTDPKYIIYAYKIVFMSDEKTLTSEEINATMNKVLKSLEFRLGAKLR